MKKNIAFLFIGFFISLSSLNAQDLSTFYSYFNNFYNINPAFTGRKAPLDINRYTQVVVSSRSPWVGIDGAPRNIMIGAHTPYLASEGVGFKFNADSRAMFQTISGVANYSHEIQLGHHHTLRFGLSAGFIQRRLNQSKLANPDYTDLTDPTLNQKYYNSLGFLSGFGALFHGKNIEIGLSSPHLIESGRAVSDYFIATGSYYIATGGKTIIKPIAVYQNIPKVKNLADLYIKTEFNENFWIQPGYRSNNTAILGLGYNLKELSFGYAYELNFGKIGNYSSGTHEVVVKVNIKKTWKSGRVHHTDHTTEHSTEQSGNPEHPEQHPKQSTEHHPAGTGN